MKQLDQFQIEYLKNKNEILRYIIENFPRNDPHELVNEFMPYIVRQTYKNIMELHKDDETA